MINFNRNIFILFSTRIIRLFAYGFLSIILALYLSKIGLSGFKIGLLMTLTLAGDAVITLWLTTSADRIGRRKMLIIGALLMVFAGVIFVSTKNYFFLIIAAIIGVISPSGGEIGPFLSIEQSALSQLLPDIKRTHAFAWYNLAGSFATALGALIGGWFAKYLKSAGIDEINVYKLIIFFYGAAGFILIILFLFLSEKIEAEKAIDTGNFKKLFGLHKSKKVVLKLSFLFALDAFGGGFVIQSLLVYWFHIKFKIDTGVLGSIFFGANLLAGISALLAVKLASKIGLIKTMVFTHIPSNILLCMVPLMPYSWLAVTVLLLRFSISQMDVPTRQSYTMAVVSPDERSAASGITTIARSIGAFLSPTLTGIFLSNIVFLNYPFFIAGILKIIYDISLYRSFQAVKPPEEIK